MRDSSSRALDPLLPTALHDLVTRAALWHDAGKAHHIFQETMERTGLPRDSGPWAKSERPGRHARPHFRHELVSPLAWLREHSGGRDDNLIAYLVAAHHGKVRVTVDPYPGETLEAARTVQGVAQGDSVPAVELTDDEQAPAFVVDLSLFDVGSANGSATWADRVLALRDDPELGPFRLAFLESLVRVADWRASQYRREHPRCSRERPPAERVRADAILGYLKAIGLLRLVAEQADSEVRGGWDGATFVLRTALDRPALEHFLHERYRPSPVFNPWNSGAGFDVKSRAQKAGQTLDAVAATTDERWERARSVLPLARTIVADIGESTSRETKTRILRVLRERYPDDGLRWLDAAVVVGGNEPRFPLLLGTGGNDGRLVFSVNFLQRALEVAGPRPLAERFALLRDAWTARARGVWPQTSRSGNTLRPMPAE